MDAAEIKAAAQAVAEALDENNPRGLRSIKQLIQMMGIEFVQAVVAETLEIEANGGMTIRDGSRRRTPGGVFFQIIKPKLPEDIRNKIFPPKNWRALKQKQKAAKQKARAAREQAAAEKAQHAAKVQQLELAAQTLRDRLTQMEAADNQSGVKMTKKLLQNAERQIAALQSE